MRLLGSLVAYQHVPVEKKIATLLLSEPEIKKVVTHVADAITTIKVGDAIITDRPSHNTFEIDSQKYFIIHSDHVSAIMEPNE